MNTNGRLGFTFIVLLAVLSLFTVRGGNLDVLIVLLLIGLLIAREMVAGGAPKVVTDRLSLFLFLGGIAFVWIVIQRVRDVLQL